MDYTTTKDFKKFKKTKLLYEPGFNAIDASIVKDEKGYPMFLKDELNHYGLKVHRFGCQT